MPGEKSPFDPLPADQSREPVSNGPVPESIRRFTVEEIERLARVLQLLDSWDRAQRPAKVKEAA